MMISTPLGLRQPLRSKDGPLPAQFACSQRVQCVPRRPGPYAVRRVVRVGALGGANDSTGAPQKHELPDQQHPKTIPVAARQLLSVTALAFFTLVATVVRDRATSPIIPPLIPRIETLTSSPDADCVVQYASATVETGIETTCADTKAPVKPSRSLLRALWGTATVPVKLVDTLLFPEESLVRPSTTSIATTTSSSSKQAVPSIRSPAADASPATQEHPATVAPAPARQTASPAPSFTDVPAAAGRVLELPSTGLDANTGLQSAEQAPSMPGMMHMLQEAFARMARQEQADSTAAAPAPADHAAALAAVRFLMGNEGMGLLPVILVTSATAAAGLMLAATMAGLAGLVDKRRASSPAQRAAEVALLDSPLQPISCPTMPGFLPMLPPSIEPIFYRWRDNDTSSGSSSDSNSSSAAAVQQHSKAPAAADGHNAAAADVAGAAEPQQEHDWWSFSQIAALRLMPLLPTSAGNNKQAAGGSSATAPDSTPAAPISAAATTAPAAVAAASSIAASPGAASEAEETSAGSFEEVAAALAQAAASTTVDPDDLAMWGSDAEVLFGPAWCYAVQLVTVDALSSPETAWEVSCAFGAAAPAKLLAQVCCFLLAAVANCRTAVGLWQPDGPPGTAAGWIWDYASRITALLLGGDPGRVEAVAEAMGIVATAASPDVMHGVLQERSQLLLAEYGELHLLGDLTFGDVPDIEAWLTELKLDRVIFAEAAYRSTILATYTVLELWPEAVEAAAPQTDAGGMDRSAQWQQPRLMMRHTQLLEQCLLDVLQGERPPKLAVAEVLSISSSPVAAGQGATQLTVMQAGPPRVQRLVSARHAALAAQLPRYSKEQLLKKHSVDDILQLPDVYNVDWHKEEMREDVVLALRHGLLLAKPPHAAMLYQFRPGWPAAQFLALAHSLLPPSELDALLDSIKLDADDQGLLASVLMLLPAAVLHVRHHWETELAEGLSSSTETATAVCLRIYTGLLGETGAPEHTALSALGMFGLNPDAVIAAATAESGMAAAPAGASSGQQLYWGPSDSLLGQLADFQGNAAGVLGIMVEHPAHLSFVVSLTLLLHLASSNGWERGSTPCSAPDEPVQLLPAWYWDILIGEFSGSNLYTLPGASMAAAVLRAGFTEAKAAAVPNGRMSVEAIALEAAQLLAQASSSSSRPAADWEHDLTKAVVATGSLTDICDPAEGALEIVDDEAAKRLGLAPWLEEDSSDADEEEAWAAEEDEGSDGDAEADSSSESPQADQEAQDSGSDSPQAAASHAEEEEQEGPTASQEEASSDEEEACMEDSSCGNALDSHKLDEAVAANKAEAEAEAAAAAKAAAEAAVAMTAASKSAYHSLMAQLEAATAEAPDALLQQLEQLSEAQDSLGRAWQLALHLVLADDVLDATASAELLQQCAATATVPLLADICALLPAAVVNYQAAATAAGGRGKGRRAESSWDATARLLTQLLSPAGTGSEGISKLCEVCGELGLYTQARWKGDSRQFRGKLQHLAETYEDAVDVLERFTELSWEPAGQHVREWLLREFEEPSQLAEVALRSCVMASYLSMELWYEQDCPVVPYDPDNTRDLYGSYDSNLTRAALLSHYELLKELQSSKQDSCWQLPELIAGAADSAENDRFVGAFMTYLCGHPPLSIFHFSPMDDTWFPALLLETARPFRFTGKLPDLASYQDFLLVLQQVQQGMSTQLQLPQASTASGSAAAVHSEASQVIEKIMRAFVMGQRVMPTRNGTHKVLRWLQAELPEWQTASQLARLWRLFPIGLDTALLQHFAASAAESSLARVCALLPAAAANVGLPSDDVADMLIYLTVAEEGPATVTAVLKELGFHGEVVAAATAAAAAATAPGERVEAAAAAIRETGLQLEVAGGFLSQLAKRNRIQAGTVPGMLVYGSIAAALPMLLDLLVDDSNDDKASTDNHPTGHDAAAADATAAVARASSSSRSCDAPLLPLKEWMWLAAQFAAIEAEGEPAGDAAAAALMQQGVLAARAREQGVLPAGFRISLSEGHKASEGRVAWRDYLDVADRAFQQRAEGYGPVVLDFKGQKRGGGILRRSHASPQIAGSQAAAAAASSPEPSGEASAGAEASSAGQNPGKVTTATTDPPAAAAAAVDGTSVDRNQASRDDKRQPKEQKSKARRQQEDAEPGLQGTKGSSSSKAAGQSTAAASSSAVCVETAEEKATSQATAATGEDLVPTVKKLLGLPVDPTDASSSSSDLVPNRLALLVCQAMLMRGDDAQQKLQAAVGYLATCSMRDTLPAMLAGCMEALFTTDDWDSLSGSARQVLSSLSVALPASSYLSLQKHLMAKGLVKELEVPAEFD